MAKFMVKVLSKAMELKEQKLLRKAYLEVMEFENAVDMEKSGYWNFENEKEEGLY